jgi:hypothetical protein
MNSNSNNHNRPRGGNAPAASTVPPHMARFIINIKDGREYLGVPGRVYLFRRDHPDWGILTEPLTIDREKGFACFRATITDAEGRTVSTATGSEDVKGFPEWIEKAETKALGRALVFAGYGTEWAPETETGPGPVAERTAETAGEETPDAGPSRADLQRAAGAFRAFVEAAGRMGHGDRIKNGNGQVSKRLVTSFLCEVLGRDVETYANGLPHYGDAEEGAKELETIRAFDAGIAGETLTDPFPENETGGLLPADELAATEKPAPSTSAVAGGL